jgi:hypothetical protein
VVRWQVLRQGQLRQVPLLLVRWLHSQCNFLFRFGNCCNRKLSVNRDAHVRSGHCNLGVHSRCINHCGHDDHSSVGPRGNSKGHEHSKHQTVWCSLASKAWCLSEPHCWWLQGQVVPIDDGSESYDCCQHPRNSSFACWPLVERPMLVGSQSPYTDSHRANFVVVHIGRRKCLPLGFPKG